MEISRLGFNEKLGGFHHGKIKNGQTGKVWPLVKSELKLAVFGLKKACASQFRVSAGHSCWQWVSGKIPRKLRFVCWLFGFDATNQARFMLGGYIIHTTCIVVFHSDDRYKVIVSCSTMESDQPRVVTTHETRA
jgi:hypothetical protein